MKTKSLFAAILMAMLAFVSVSCGSDEIDLNVDQTVGEKFQQIIQNNFPGKAWKYVEAHEVLPDGSLEKREYWKDMCGGGPSYYYFRTATEATRYFYADHLPAQCFLNFGYRLDAETGGVYYSYSGQIIWSIKEMYKKGGLWYLKVVENHGVRVGQDGELIPVYLYTIYKQMTEKELKSVEKEYDYDYSKANY